MLGRIRQHEIRQWLLQQRVHPGAALADAIKYMADPWSGPIRFVDDPKIPFTNNRAERELRPCVVGRKIHYGSRSKRGTKVAALFYSLLESTRLCGVDPREYLLAATKAVLNTPSAILLPHPFAA